MIPIVRPLWTDDLEDIMKIEEASYPFPWTEGIFRDCIRAGYACYGLQLEQQLVGYSISNWAAGESHLLNLCIEPRWRCRGFGRMLLEHTVNKARSLDCHVMFLEVRPSNTDAAKLYRNLGFSEIGKRQAYYQSQGGREDAVVMRLDLAVHAGK